MSLFIKENEDVTSSLNVNRALKKAQIYAQFEWQKIVVIAVMCASANLSAVQTWPTG